MDGSVDGQSTRPAIIYPASLDIRMEGLKAAKLISDLNGKKFYRHHFGLEIVRELRQGDDEALTEGDCLAIRQLLSEQLPPGLTATNFRFDVPKMDGSTQYIDVFFNIFPQA